MAKPRGIPDVPLFPTRVIEDKQGVKHEVLGNNSTELRRFLMDMREQVLQVRQRLAVPDPPTNLKATAQAFQNLIQWTRSADADYYEVMHSLTPSLLDMNLQTTDVGNSALWQDTVGNVGVRKFYWIRARKLTGGASQVIGPVNATTLASGAGITPPTPPPPGNIVVIDQATGRRIAYTLAGPRSYDRL